MSDPVSNEIEIARISRSDSKEVRVTLVEYRNRWLLSIREFYEADHKMRPSYKGITVPISMAVEFSQTINAAVDHAGKQGLLGSDGQQ